MIGFRHLIARFALILAVAGCAPTMWECDLTITVDNRTVSGSGSGSTEEEARRAALAVACPKLGLAGERLNACKAGRLFDLGLSVSFDWHCQAR